MTERAYKYETVAASQTDQVLGTDGAKSDAIVTLIISVATAATGTVSIQDGGGTDIPLTAANTPIGVYTLHFGKEGWIAQVGSWAVTTGAGASVVAVGYFS